MEKEKQKRAMLAGIAAMVLFMIGDWLLDVKGSGNKEVGLFVNSNWPAMSMWRFEVSILLAAAAMPLYWIALKELRHIVTDACSRKPKGHALAMKRLFDFSSAAGLISVLFIHIMCCLLPIIFKTSYGMGSTFEQAADVTNQVGMYILLPFMIYYLVMDIGMSVVMVYLILTRRFALPKWMACFHPVGGLVLCEIFAAIPVVWCNDVSVAFESMGHLLMFVAGYVLLQQFDKIKTIIAKKDKKKTGLTSNCN